MYGIKFIQDKGFWQISVDRLNIVNHIRNVWNIFKTIVIQPWQKLQVLLTKPDSSENPFCCFFDKLTIIATKKIVANGGAALSEEHGTLRFLILHYFRLAFQLNN
ncbi:hypothetical protein CA265_17330 [Sphingobacteriaceae bacterium GW460-11-11-14-LB5]|nr:hypothetical protein CA265_17330 [Sphingobacteriaceae bacterium GW460-11-11-14-LB5]